MRDPLTDPARPLPVAATTGSFLYRAGLIALLLALIGLAYHAAPQNGFHLDDAVNIVRHGPMHIEDPGLGSLARAAREAVLPQRVVPNVTLALDWWRGGGDPAPFQVTNLVIHAATALAVLSLLLLLLRRSGAAPAQAWPPAVIATAAWALHPIQVQAVTYIVQRMTSLAALFMLVAVVAYVRARLTHRRGWFAASLLAATAAWYSKENAYILPALIVLAEYTLCREPDRRIRSHLDRLVLALPALFAAWIALDLAVLHGPLWERIAPAYAQRDFTLGERLLTQPRVIAFHIGQILLPLPERFSIEHDFALSRSLWQPWTTPLALAAVVGWIAGGVWLSLRSRFPVAGFLLLWVPGTLAIESSVVALEMVFEHRMYLPSVGLAGLLALALLRAARTRWRIATLVAALLGVIGLLYATSVRVPVWKTPVTLYEQAARVAPQRPRVWSNLATAYATVDRSDDAIAAYTRALELDPQRAIVYLNRGSSYRKTGNHAAAEADYRRFMALEPRDFRGPYALGALYNALGRHEQAAPWLRRALLMDERSALPLVELAQLYVATGRADAALTALRDARRRDAAIADARFHALLGKAHLALGRFGDAIEALNRSLLEEPANIDARLDRAYALLRGGRPAQALGDFDTAIAAAPNDARAHYGRAEALKLLGADEQAAAAARRALTIDPGHGDPRQLLPPADAPGG